jgi:hypothetical protein
LSLLTPWYGNTSNFNSSLLSNNPASLIPNKEILPITPGEGNHPWDIYDITKIMQIGSTYYFNSIQSVVTSITITAPGVYLAFAYCDISQPLPSVYSYYPQTLYVGITLSSLNDSQTTTVISSSQNGNLYLDKFIGTIPNNIAPCYFYSSKVGISGNNYLALSPNNAFNSNGTSNRYSLSELITISNSDIINNKNIANLVVSAPSIIGCVNTSTPALLLLSGQITMVRIA